MDLQTPQLPPAPTPLCAALTHELSGPLGGVLAMLDLLDRQALPGDADACVRTLRDSAERMHRTLSHARDLLDDAGGRLQLEREPFCVRAVMDDLQNRWSDQEPAGAALLTSYEGDGELFACGDAARLGQVFDALIGRAAGRSRGAVEASISARLLNGRIRIAGSVRDELRSPVDPAAVFDISAGDRSGLALSVAAALLRRMGGSVEARGNAGAGTTVAFHLDLPQAVAAPEAPANPAADDWPNLHVLIVDDNATNRLVAEAFCDMFGCTSDCAEDGMEALEAVRVRRYDIVLMDVKMPRMDGVEATRAIRALPGPERDTPIVALTANADPEDIRRYVAAGMAGIVEKPIKADRLAEVLNAVFDADEPAEARRTAA